MKTFTDLEVNRGENNVLVAFLYMAFKSLVQDFADCDLPFVSIHTINIGKRSSVLIPHDRSVYYRVDVFSGIFVSVHNSGNIIAPDAIMWIVLGRIRGLMPLTATSLNNQDQLAAALGGLAFLSSQKDLIGRLWSLIEKVFFRGFYCNPILQQSVVELEPMGTLDNIMPQPHQDGRGAARDRHPKT